MKRFLCVSAGLLLLASGAHAQVAAGTVLSEDGAGYPHAFVVMDNGDVYRSDYVDNVSRGPQGPWFLACNLFSAGGPRSPVVGVGAGAIVLTAAGGYYRLGTGAGQPCFAIFDGIVDHPAGQSFVTIGSNASINGCHIYAVTDGGCVYRAWIGCGGGGWEYAGCLPTGPTAGRIATWGSLKARYR